MADVLHKVISVSGEIDRYIFRKIVDYRNSKMHDMLVQYYCDNEIRQAEECWKNGEYLKAKDLFERNYKNLTSTKACQNIGELARQQGYSVIKFKSYRAEGINYVIYDNFENILLPRNIVPVN